MCIVFQIDSVEETITVGNCASPYVMYNRILFYQQLHLKYLLTMLVLSVTTQERDLHILLSLLVACLTYYFYRI